jgi:hypothetical protein
MSFSKNRRAESQLGQLFKNLNAKSYALRKEKKTS